MEPFRGIIVEMRRAKIRLSDIQSFLAEEKHVEVSLEAISKVARHSISRPFVHSSQGLSLHMPVPQVTKNAPPRSEEQSSWQPLTFNNPNEL